MDRIVVDRIVIYKSLEPFLWRLITGNEMWVKYGNNVRMRLWYKTDEITQTVANAGLTSRKVILNAAGQTTDSTLYCQRLKLAIEMKKWPAMNNKGSVLFHHHHFILNGSIRKRAWYMPFKQKLKT